MVWLEVFMETQKYEWGQRIYRLRKARDLTLDQVGEACDWTGTTQHRIEKGHTRLNSNHVTRLAKALDVPEIEILIDPADLAQSDEEREMLLLSRSLTREQITQLLGFVQSILHKK